MTVEQANPRPCSACPWRLENQGKRHPHGWYTKANLDRLWAGMRRGEAMTCHPTDPGNPVPDDWKPVAEGTTTHECAGVLILVQREIRRFEALCLAVESGELDGEAWKIYRRLAPRGLTREGMAEAVSRAVFGGIPLIGGRPMKALDLNEPVGLHSLPDWNADALVPLEATE